METAMRGEASQMMMRRHSGVRTPLWRFMYSFAMRSLSQWPTAAPTREPMIGAK